MDRAQFMEQLKRLLSDISEAERLEALDYYESYFDDAGAENEAAVIRELGSPGKVAAIIKADLRESNDGYAEYTELGYEDTRTKEPGQVPDKYTAVAAGEKKEDASGKNAEGQNTSGERKFGRQRAGGKADAQGEQGGEQKSRAERGYHAEKKSNAGIILIVILLVFLSPFIVGAAGGVLGIIVAIILLPFLIVLALGVGAIGLMLGAVVCIATGIGLCAGFPASGILTIGIGCVLMALGIIFLVLVVLAAGKFLPWILRKTTDFCHKILNRGRKEDAGA